MGTFVDDGNFRFNGQTGVGKYMSPSPGQWDVGTGNWLAQLLQGETPFGLFSFRFVTD
jgi:hypothetical protein